MEKFTNPVERQNDGRQTPATHGGLQDPGEGLETLKGSKRINYPATTDRGSGLALAHSIMTNK